MKTTIMSPVEFAALDPADTLVFDCRHDLFRPGFGRTAYAAGHLPGAYHLHLDHDLSGKIIPGTTGRHPLPDMTAFADFIGGFGLTARTQVLCYDDKGGGIAARLWWMMRSLGHDAVAVLNGGIRAWEAAGYDQEVGVNNPEEPATSSAPHLAPSTLLRACDRALIDVLKDNPEWRLIDSRTAPRFRGEQEPIDPVAGHIPGAVNLPWPENLTEGRFKTPAELKIRFADLVDEADHNVFYCGSGVTACHNILAYNIAFGKMPGLYPGSWSEWIVER